MHKVALAIERPWPASGKFLSLFTQTGLENAPFSCRGPLSGTLRVVIFSQDRRGCG